MFDLCAERVYNAFMERNRDFVYLDEFVWDTAKNEANIKAHGIDFETATLVFDDPFLYEEYDVAHSDSEYRQRFVGSINGLFIATVIAADQNGLVRIISARKACRKEVKIYEQSADSIQGAQ